MKSSWRGSEGLQGHTRPQGTAAIRGSPNSESREARYAVLLYCQGGPYTGW
jgi:hypothetical protein